MSRGSKVICLVINPHERLGAMGLAERKEVNLDFSKEDDEKRPRPRVPKVLHWKRVFNCNVLGHAVLIKLHLKTRPHNHQKP